ncbi:MAG: PAS domain S-box protein, partial [Imperialibacter sp.]
KITDLNEALIKVTGLSRAELQGTDFSTYFTSPQKAQEEYLQVFEKGFVSGYPLTIMHKDGRLTDVLYNASVYKDSKGNVLGVFAAARDVTEQTWAIELRLANKELAFQNEEKEKRAAELVIANEELVFQNREKEQRAADLGVANKELVYQNDEKEKRAAELRVANQELVFQNDEKQKRANELSIANKELAFQNDEKEKRATELRLANYARSLIEASRDPLVTISTGGKITDMNEAFASITASTREKLVGSDFGIYFTDPVKAREIYEEVFTKGFVADYPLTIVDHELTAVLFNGSVYKNEKGDVLGAVVVARDITEQKRIEKELIEAKVAAELATTIAEEAKEKA